MAKLISPDALIGKDCKLEFPVRIFAYASIQAKAEIGRYCYINRYSFVHGSVRMGRYCSLARGVDLGAKGHRLDLLSTHPFLYNKKHFESVPEYTSFNRRVSVKSQPTIVGHDVWIGAKAIVSTGVTIGTGAVIAANSFVREDVPAYAIVGGTPARIIRYRFPKPTIERLLTSEWWQFHPHELKDIHFDDENIENVLDQIEELKASNKIKTVINEDNGNSVLLGVLSEAMLEMDMPDRIVSMIMETAARAKLSFDPDSTTDHAIYRNKLVAVKELINVNHENDASTDRRIQNIFSSKN